MNEKPLKPWIVAEQDGKILAGNCDCMAGLGETCSHVASLLWATATGVEKRNALTVTQKSAYWVIPPAIKKVPYAPMSDIDFVGKKRKCRSIDDNADIAISPVSKRTINQPESPTDKDKESFFCSLAKCSQAKPAVLAIVHPHSEAYVPASLDKDLPLVLSELYRKEHLGVGFTTLLDIASSIKLSVTQDQAKAVEAKTREQANTKLWFRMRAGRITASKFKSACCTDPASPSKSLIMSICYPEMFRFSTEATTWGCQHEKLALEIYSNRNVHENIQVSKCGFFIRTEYPFLGASPDAVVDCLCCGKGICEVTK